MQESKQKQEEFPVQWVRMETQGWSVLVAVCRHREGWENLAEAQWIVPLYFTGCYPVT